jgi:N-formylglutamate amidohydrolase
MQDVYSLFKPKKPSPVIFDSPHSGRVYPKDFDYACTFADLRRCEDEYLDTLFDGVRDLDCAFLCAQFPRSYIDVNRAVDDIDPALLDAPWRGTPIHPSERSDAGIGLIRRLVSPGMPVYARMLSQAEIERRIATYYAPYHTQLEALIFEAHYAFGHIVHVNCHSMPDSTARPRRPIGLVAGLGKTVDFALGDRDGTSCDPALTRAVRDFIRSLGYSVTINDPFKGVELVARHSNPARGFHSLQIEVNKRLYMDEATSMTNKNFTRLKADIDKICTFIVEHTQGQLRPLAAD